MNRLTDGLGHVVVPRDDVDGEDDEEDEVRSQVLEQVERLLVDRKRELEEPLTDHDGGRQQQQEAGGLHDVAVGFAAL